MHHGEKILNISWVAQKLLAGRPIYVQFDIGRPLES
jgi:hypothetical protein